MMSDNYNKTGLEILGLRAPDPEGRRGAIRDLRETDTPPLLHRIKRGMFSLCKKVDNTGQALCAHIRAEKPSPASTTVSTPERQTRIIKTDLLGIAQIIVTVSNHNKSLKEPD